MTGAAPAQQRTARRADRPARSPRADLGVFGVLVGLIFATITSFFFGVAIRLIGLYPSGRTKAWVTPSAPCKRTSAICRVSTLAAGRGHRGLRGRNVGASHQAVSLDPCPEFIERARGNARDGADANATARPDLPSGRVVLHEAGRWVEIAIYVAQDTAIRLAIALYALPTFAMAILIGLVDGPVRRDPAQVVRRARVLLHLPPRQALLLLVPDRGLYRLSGLALRWHQPPRT